jgi:hypothetical protein
MSVLWTIIIGFVAGVIAKFIMPGPNEPAGFILTISLGSSARLSPLSWDRLSAGTGRAKARA